MAEEENNGYVVIKYMSTNGLETAWGQILSPWLGG